MDYRGLKLTKATDGPISKYLNRKISTRITIAIVRYGIPLTPNQVSAISLLLVLLAAYLILIGENIIAGILIQTSSIIDGVDGELARILNKTSKVGGFLDSILDRIADILVISCMAYYALLATEYSKTMILLVALAAISGDIMVSYLHARGEASLGKHPALIGRVPQFASRDVRLFIIFIGLLFSFYIEPLIIVAAIAYSYVVAKTIDVLINYKK